MKSFVRLFVALCVIAAGLWLVQNFLFPAVYKIKEPHFAMPLKWDKEVKAAEDLPVREDAYGEGHFGARRRGGRRHNGLDLAAKIKSPVYASKSGWARTYCVPGGYGNLVIINHPGGCETRYGHLDSFTVKKFQWVRMGDTIGYVGKSGNANLKGIAPHLHFEIRYRDKPVDPVKELVKGR